MHHINKIMVALGFTEYAQETFDYATTLAQSIGAELFIASVINAKDIEAVSTISSLGYEVDGEHYIRGIKAERRKMLEQILEKSPYAQENIRLIFKVGHPIDELLKLTVEQKADLIVMGVKGRTDLEQVFVGSVAEKMFRKSPVPILSVRDARSAKRMGKWI